MSGRAFGHTAVRALTSGFTSTTTRDVKSLKVRVKSEDRNPAVRTERRARRRARKTTTGARRSHGQQATVSVMFQNSAFQVQSVCESLERPADDSHMCSSKSEKSRSPTNRTFRHIERASGAETCRSRRSSSLSDRWNPDAGCRFFAVPRGRRARALSRRVRVLAARFL